MKVALLVAYDGTEFHGFARQRSCRTVQGTLEDALALILRHPVRTTGAGRTDTGVHASGQVVSFEVRSGADPNRMMHRLNRLLAPEIAVRAAVVAPNEFDARFSARRRSYEYRCYTSAAPDPFLDRFALWAPWEVSVPAMRLAAEALLGEHDFSAFCRKRGNSTTRRLRAIRVRPGAQTLSFRVEADAFCHQMVRSLVGLLLEIGRGRRAVQDAAVALESRRRLAAGPVAPARGLTLIRVEYRPDPFAAVPVAEPSAASAR